MPRTHPIALSIYLYPGIMSVLYMLDVTEAGKITDATSAVWAAVWTFTLALGSVMAMLGLLIQRQGWSTRWHVGLIAETTGAAILAGELTVYAITLAQLSPPKPGALPPSLPWYTLIVTWSVVAGCTMRAAQAIAERGDTLKLQAALSR